MNGINATEPSLFPLLSIFIINTVTSCQNQKDSGDTSSNDDALTNGQEETVEEDDDDEDDPDLPSSKSKVTKKFDSLRAFAGSTPMVYVEGGMYKGEYIEPFYMDIHMVTVEQYIAAVKAGICPAPPENDYWSDTYKKGPSKLPITNVSYYNGRTLGNWIGKQLPSEKQWEWAAKSGHADYIYPWGNEEPDETRACWDRYDYETDKGEGPCEVMSFPPNELGLYDMAGSFYEFTTTYHDDDSTILRLKGGNWNSNDGWRLKVDTFGLATPYHRGYSSDSFRFIKPAKKKEN